MLQIAKIWIGTFHKDKRIRLVGTCRKVPLVIFCGIPPAGIKVAADRALHVLEDLAILNLASLSQPNSHRQRKLAKVFVSERNRSNTESVFPSSFAWPVFLVNSLSLWIWSSLNTLSSIFWRSPSFVSSAFQQVVNRTAAVSGSIVFAAFSFGELI